MRKLRQAPWTGQLLCIWAQPLLICLCVNLFYQIAAFFPNQKYLYWAQNATACKSHLPDIVLDLHSLNEANLVTSIGDALPGVALVLGLVLCIVTKDIEVWSITILNQTFLMFFNAICEFSTLMPSSYGYDRCMDYLGIKSADDYKFSVNLTGSCVAMIWSGHTIHTMLGTYATCTIVGRHYGCAGFLRRTCNGSGPEGRTVVMWLAATLVAALLLLNKGHYTVDIELAILIGSLTLTNDSLRAYQSRFFMRQAVFVSGFDKEDYEAL